MSRVRSPRLTWDCWGRAGIASVRWRRNTPNDLSGHWTGKIQFDSCEFPVESATVGNELAGVAGLQHQMAWSIPQSEHRIFVRNPLVGVIVDLRYYPILRVAERVAEFQDLVRAEFPRYQEANAQVVDLQPVGNITIRSEKVLQFTKVDGSRILTLTTGGLTLEVKKHDHRADFIRQAQLGVSALLQLYGPVIPIRLGLRYVNLINQDTVQRDLKRPTSWQSLIADDFLSVPTRLASLEGTLYASEVVSTMPTGGMTLRHGLVRGPDGVPTFQIDLDRYVETAIALDRIEDTLLGFSNDVFSVFVAAMGPDLKEWMPPLEGNKC